MIEDDSFLTFDGEPITGRVPAKLIVSGEQAIAPEQLAAIQRTYRKFAQGQRVSLVRFATHYSTLPDGTQVRIERNADQGDRVFVTPPDTAARAITIEGYAFVPADKDHTTGWSFGAIPDSARAFLPAPAKRPISVIPGVELHVKINAGAVDWHGDRGVIISWDHGGNNRYDTQLWNTVFTGTNSDNSAIGIYYKGTKINTPQGVSAAAIFSGFLVMIGNDGTIYSAPSPIGQLDASLKAGQFTKHIDPTWTTVTPSGSVTASRRASAWHFKPDGSRAAAAFVASAFGIDTWTLLRMRTEALSMTKRYLDLTVSSGAVVAVWSELSFTCEPIAAYANGSGTPMGSSVQTGSLVFTGKRLWGVDYDVAGTELEIVFQRAGTGNYPTPAPSTTDTRYWTTHWGVYVNGTELFKASYRCPTGTFTYNAGAGVSAFSYDGTEDQSGEYIAVHAMDARSMAAILERVTITQAGSTLTGITSTSGPEPSAPATMSAQIEVIVEGVVVYTVSETLTAGLTPAWQYGSVDPRYGISFERDDHHSNVGTTGFGRAEVLWPEYPQVGDWLAENIYEELYRTASPAAGGRMHHTLFQSYPNQVTDALTRLFWQYDYANPGHIFDFDVQHGPKDDPFLGTWTGAIGDTDLEDTYFPKLGLWKFGDIGGMGLPAGLAIPMGSPLHLGVSSCDMFVRQFYDTMQRIAQVNQSLTVTGIDPTYFASLFTRPSTSDPWTSNDLLSPVESKVTTVDGAIETATFHIDPLRVV